MEEIYLFGSIMRGDIDSGSDVDILVIVDNLEERTNYPLTWSVYTKQRIKELYNRGTLFSWHLYLEAKLIYPLNSKGIIRSIGKPSEYTNYIEEVEQLTRLAREAIGEVKVCTNSWIYEYGLLYVAARDIAMAAFKKLNNRFVFSRFAPFELNHGAFPFTEEEYKYIMNCRRASTRGLSVDMNTNIQQTIEHKSNAFLDWCASVLRSLKE